MATPSEGAEALLNDLAKAHEDVPHWKFVQSEQPSLLAIWKADPGTQLEVFLRLLHSSTQGYNMTEHLILDRLARRKLPHTRESVKQVLECLNLSHYPNAGWFGNIANALEGDELRQQVLPELQALLDKMRTGNTDATKRKFVRTLEQVMAGGAGTVPALRLAEDEWGRQAKPHLETLEPERRSRWEALLRQARTGSGSVPNKLWLEAVSAPLAEIGEAEFVNLTQEWLGFFRRSSNKPPTRDGNYQIADTGAMLDPDNADVLRSLLWLCGHLEHEHPNLASSVADAAIAGYKKISGVGPRNAKVAGAAVYALKTMPGLSAAGQLERVKLNVKQPSYLSGIDQALEAVAKRANLSREDLEELTVPGHELEHGKRRVDFLGPYAELVLEGLEVKLNWFGADGKPRKSEPSEVKTNFKAELKALKLERDAIEKMLSAQRDRLERLPLLRRSWPLGTWQSRYLEHPLLSGLVRDLIWHVQDHQRHVDALWLEGQPVDASDAPLEFSPEAIVTPWHPVYCDASEVLAWREFIARHEITQPFKQAHREVYILTEAERRTQTYSNRFAAHILKQHQFNALCLARGWHNSLRLMVDDTYPPATLELPQWNVRAEYWVEGAGDNYGTDTNDSGTYLYIATDQVRFYSIEAAQNYAHAGGGGYGHRWHGAPAADPLTLEQIPSVVFSEVMRDVDLFVGVASVGNDPTWLDGGPTGHRDYWHSYSFGDLSATAESRKALLELLLPRLKIKDVASIAGKFLKVRGSRRSYKIHLGSGNILMEPNDQYLCIVPGSTRDAVDTQRLHLPFAGDRMLSIILSKAFLLAEDSKITDPTITRQL